MVQAKDPQTAADIDVEALRAIEQLLASSPDSSLRAPSGKSVQLPASLRALLLQAVQDLAGGKAISLVASEKELTTQQAADMLNISRPYLITLLERGELPFHKTGSHRRVPLAALLEYKRRRDEGRRSTLSQITREAQELGLYEV
jgi:excisionase family DNA binding protein